MNIKFIIVLVVAVLAMAGLASAAHHKRGESDLSKACKKAFDDVVMSFEEGAAGKANCSVGDDVMSAFAGADANAFKTMEADYCESDGACAKAIDAGVEVLEAACVEELDYANKETSNFFIIDIVYGAMKGYKSYLCLSDSDGNNCGMDAVDWFEDYVKASNASSNEDVMAFCERDGCYSDVAKAFAKNVEILQDYDHSEYYMASTIIEVGIDELFCTKVGSTYCVYEYTASNAAFQEAVSDLPLASDKEVKDEDVNEFYDIFDTYCGECSMKIIDTTNQIAAIVGDAGISRNVCSTDGDGGYCYLKHAQGNVNYLGAIIACPVGDSECEAYQKISVDTDDAAECGDEFDVDVAGTQKCSDGCKATLPSYLEYMGCCASASWRNIFTDDKKEVNGISIIATHEEAMAYFEDCGLEYDYESRCEPRVSTSFTIAMGGLDISGATEKEIEALVALIVQDVAAYANVEEADVVVTVTDLGDGVTEVEVVITVDSETAVSSLTATVSNIDEDDFVETADSKFVSNDGLEVDGVTGGSFSGVAALVPTAFAVLCALVALLF